MGNRSGGYRVNHMIRVREVRVIDPEGKQLGVLSVPEARALAEEQGLDLVEVAPNERPPVCRIMDYGKFKYQQSKRTHQAKKKQKNQLLKEVKLTPKTDEHDVDVKLRHARRFLGEGNKVKVTVVFRGREMMHRDIGRRLLDRIAASLEDAAALEQPPKQEGRQMSSIFIPKAVPKETAGGAAAKTDLGADQSAPLEAAGQPSGEAEPVQS